MVIAKVGKKAASSSESVGCLPLSLPFHIGALFYWVTVMDRVGGGELKE